MVQRLVDERPYMLGALGLGIGAMIGLMLPSPLSHGRLIVPQQRQKPPLAGFSPVRDPPRHLCRGGSSRTAIHVQFAVVEMAGVAPSVVGGARAC